MSRKSDRAARAAAVRELGSLARWGDILLPGEVDPPIFGPSVRAALHEWMTEINLREDLSAVRVKPRSKALLYGPPGCGKTTYAHNLAARLDLPLVCVRSESIIGKYLGQTGDNIGSLFDDMAETEGKAVVFFDEVDALGGKRMNDQGASVERANSLNVLLRRIESFSGICMAATNRKEHLDDALWRRFDLMVEIALPGDDERFAILKRYGEPFLFSDDDLEMLVDVTGGASPDLLRKVMEGMKRALILWPAMRRPVNDPVEVLRAVVASVSPPPEYDPRPALWEDRSLLKTFADMIWPPPRMPDPPPAREGE